MGWSSRFRRIGREIRRIGRQFGSEVGRWSDHAKKWAQEWEDEMTRFDEQWEEAIKFSSDDLKGVTGSMRSVPTDSTRYRRRGFADWRDVRDPFLKGERPFAYGDGVRSRNGFVVPIASEFYSPSAGQPASGIKFIGYAPPNASFDALSMSLSGGPVVDSPSEDRFWSARLVQRNSNGLPLYVSGSAFARSRDDVIFREDLRIPAGANETVYMTSGGPLEEYLPMFVSLADSGNLAGTPNIDQYQVQVTFHMNSMAVI